MTLHWVKLIDRYWFGYLEKRLEIEKKIIQRQWIIFINQCQSLFTRKKIVLQQTLCSLLLQTRFCSSSSNFRRAGEKRSKVLSCDCFSAKAGQSSIALHCHPSWHPPSIWVIGRYQRIHQLFRGQRFQDTCQMNFFKDGKIICYFLLGSL